MTQPKTLRMREKELRALLTTPEGRQAIEELTAQYTAQSGKGKPERPSAITYILVHERGKGLIDG